MRVMHEYLLDAAQRYPSRTAIVCDGAKVTYGEFLLRICNLAHSFRTLGLCRKDRLMVLVNNKIDYLVVTYAGLACGAIIVPLGEGSSLQTVQSVTKDCEPFALVTSLEDLSTMPFIHDQLSCRILLLEKLIGGEPEACGGREKLGVDAPDENSEAMILYTSGTTGAKKGVLLSHRNLVRTARTINEFMRFDSSAVEYVSVPLTHSFGFGRTRCIFLSGGTIVLNNGILNPIALAQAVEEYSCDAISTVPSGFAMFLGRFETLLERFRFQIRFIELGSSPMPLEHKRRLLGMFPNARICMHYGLTEASRSSFIELRSEVHKLETVGRPSPHVEIAIRGESGRDVSRGTAGEIVIRGDHVALGYWRNRTLTEERFAANGWFHTGDYGFFDDDGYLVLLGRKDDMINMGGIKIFPTELEDKIKEAFPGADICIVGVPDPMGILGEIPVVCYRSEEEITQADLLDRLWNSVDRHKIPRQTCRCAEIPRTANGKIVRHRVREMVLESLPGARHEETHTIHREHI